jgi:hypothetical protein
MSKGRTPVGLISEIIAAALDEKTSSSELLRKALVASRRLGNAEVADWVQYELNGFPHGVELPSYRRIKGELQGEDDWVGWKPVLFTKNYGDIDRASIHQSIAELEAMQDKAGTGFLYLSLPHENQQLLRKATGEEIRFALCIPQHAVVRCVQNVRNLILEWALKLESEGVTGQGTSFSPQEVKAASTVSYVIHNNIGTMQNSQIQQHSTGTQAVTMGADLGALRDLMESVLARSAELGDASGEAKADAQTVITQLESGKPKDGIVRASLQSLRSILENAAGSALASDVLPKLLPYLAAAGSLLS